MKKAQLRKTKKSNKTVSVDLQWRMYEFLFTELRHQHNVWIDNYRVILTFNSILLPGSFAVFTLIAQGKLSMSGLALRFLPWSIVVLSTIGVFTVLVMMIIIFRISALTALRQREIREIETQMLQNLPVHPFLDGYILGGGKISGTGFPTLPDIKPMRWYWFRVRFGYALIGLGFIIAYTFLGVASIALM